MAEQVVSLDFPRQEAVLMSFITRGEARVLQTTMQDDGVERTVLSATLFETVVLGRDGGRVVIPHASHTIVETAGVDVGRINIALSAAESALLPVGKGIRFHTRFTISSVVYYYWGTIPEVRDAL